MTDYAKVWADANEAAQKAIDDLAAKYGRNDRAGGYDSGSCGFAWVILHPARGAFVNWCKAQNIRLRAERVAAGGKDWPVHEYGDIGYPKGWQIWKPGTSKYHGQSVDTYEVAAKAFAGVLRENGISCNVGSRLD